MKKNNYSIYVLEYAYVEQYPNSGIINGTHNSGTRKLPYGYALIRGNGRNIMVDVGYNHQEYGGYLGDKFGVVNWHSPRDVLAEVGVTPEEIDTVIITHAHFDHMGNTDAFPNATFYIQERELSQWIWAMAQPAHMQWMMTGTDPADILRVVELARDGRLVSLSGNCENIAPGIDVHTAFDTHTYGSMWLNVRNDLKSGSDNNWVLAGDLVYSYENLVEKPVIRNGEVEGTLNLKPVGLAMGNETNLVLSSDEMLKAVNYQVKRVIPVHEQRVTEVFPSRVSDSGLFIAEITCADDLPSYVSLA
ncbi:N-acyl homoserine lactonase family protein [Klebsiella pneumoniae]|uniref:N-acyl homoserine lactonase family protein n=1 Tax=Klebsiella pneumoniae TaxID=573 RepID=UPI0007CD2C7F|nr:N-acyl homoserine lactonase family protein [Klebsiella pneumoniae]SAV16545.1 metallo-beta-lactamase [Klebsiella pneumoniae]